MQTVPIFLVAALLFVAPVLSLEADSSTAAIDALKVQLQKACETHNLTSVKKCYYVEGAPSALMDISINVWQEYFNANDKTAHWVFEKIVYMSVDQAKADKSNNPKAITAMTGPRIMNGTTYRPNLKVVGFLTAFFKQGASDGGTVQPVGIAPDGSAKLVLACPVK